MKTTHEIGITVFLRPTVYNRAKEVLEGTLTKTGRKYYTVTSGSREFRFDIEDRTQVSEYSTDYILHFSREDVNNEIEREDLIKRVSNYFQIAVIQNCHLTLEQLRKIAVMAGIISQPVPEESSAITQDSFNQAAQCLIDNGHDEGDAKIILQALCYILCDEETEHFMGGNRYGDK